MNRDPDNPQYLAGLLAAPRARPETPLDEVHKVFRAWLSPSYDVDVLDVVLSAVAAHKLGGDPLWPMVVGGPGAAKTETVQTLAGVGAFVKSTIKSEGALLSATPKREKAKGATGGLLRELGDDGILVFKDFTSILAMPRETRGTLLAALREIYDGRWQRNVGVDGGLTLTWEGRICIVGAVTTAWDSHYSVIAAMGDRFLLVRMDSTAHRVETGSQALANIGQEEKMREALVEAVADLFSALPDTPVALSDDTRTALLAMAGLVTLARTAVDTDYRGDVVDVHAPEAPTRMVKQLGQLVRGAHVIGHPNPLALAIRCCRDSVPPLRLQMLADISVNSGDTLAAIATRTNRPRRTLERVLDALQMLDLVKGEKDEDRSRWRYSPGKALDVSALKRIQEDWTICAG